MPRLIQLSLLLILGLVIACAPAEEAPTENTPAAEASASNHQAFRPPPERFNRSQSSPSWMVSYQAEPDPIPLNQHFRLLLNVQNAKSRQPAPDDLQVTLDATMPAHNHGMNVKPELNLLGNGRYEVQGLLFHMTGYWEISVQLQAPGAEAETVLFGVNADVKPTAR
ncbi:MAG: FixH family protein [Candidatus Sericytochromatia bacterium]|nr:FixH family protein [Candidatus Sericytochromatia bacterium]